MKKGYQQNNNPHCWDFMNCPEKTMEKCEAYHMHMGKECWFLRDLEKGGPNTSKTGGCLNCKFFKHYSPDLSQKNKE